MKILIQDYIKYIQMEAIKTQNENRLLILEYREKIKKRALWNFFLGQSEEVTSEWIKYLTGDRLNEPNGLTLPYHIKVPFNIFYTPLHYFEKELNTIKYIEDTRIENSVEVSYKKGMRIVKVLNEQL